MTDRFDIGTRVIGKDGTDPIVTGVITGQSDYGYQKVRNDDGVDMVVSEAEVRPDDRPLRWCGDETTHDPHGAWDILTRCPGRPQPDTQPSPEQYLAYLRGAPDHIALDISEAIRGTARLGDRCWEQDHNGRMARLEEALTQAHNEALSMALDEVQRLGLPVEGTTNIYRIPEGFDVLRQASDAINGLRRLAPPIPPPVDDVAPPEATAEPEPPEPDPRRSYKIGEDYYRIYFPVTTTCETTQGVVPAWMRRRETGAWEMVGCVCHHLPTGADVVTVNREQVKAVVQVVTRIIGPTIESLRSSGLLDVIQDSRG